MALEGVLSQLPVIMEPGGSSLYQPSTFFEDQLTAFEVWVEVGDTTQIPEQLPSLMMGLGQASFRVRALMLLCTYLDTGPSAVHNALFCGVLPYLNKLILIPDMLFLVSVAWLQIVNVDPEVACTELAKVVSGAERYFIHILQLNESSIRVLRVGDSATAAAHPASTSPTVDPTKVEPGSHGSSPTPGAGPSGTPAAATPQTVEEVYMMENVALDRCQSVACYLLCSLMQQKGEKMQVSCWNIGLAKALFSLMQSDVSASAKSWACLALGRLVDGLHDAREWVCDQLSRRRNILLSMLSDRSPAVRASGCFVLGKLLGSRLDVLPETEGTLDRRVHFYKTCVRHLCEHLYDVSPAVRDELMIAAFQVVRVHGRFACDVGQAPPAINEQYILSHAEQSFQLLQSEMGIEVHSTLTAVQPESELKLPFIHRDEAPPPPQPNATWQPTNAGIRVTVAETVHDACVILARLYRGCDDGLTKRVKDAITKLENAQPCVSVRIEAEARRTMQSLVDAGAAVTEADRARERRNMDLMRQAVLNNSTRQFGPPAAAQSNNGTSGGPERQETATSPQVPSLKPHHSCVSLGTLEPVVAGAFRALESQVVVADRSGKVMVVSYESIDRLSTISSFHHGRIDSPAMVTQMHVVNDLADKPMLLVADTLGIFSLYSNLLQDAKGEPRTSSLSFTVGPATIPTRIVSDYRPRDGVLFYGGEFSRNVHVLSLTEEQPLQEVVVPGDAPLTCVSCDKSVSGRSLWTGFSDSTVKFLDDRKGDRLISLVSILEDDTLRPGRQFKDAVLAITTDTENHVFVATSHLVRIWDLRYPKKTWHTLDLSPHPANVSGDKVVSSTASLHSTPQVGPPPSRAVGFSFSSQTGLMAMLTAEGMMDICSMRTTKSLDSVLGKPIRAVKTSDGSASSSTPINTSTSSAPPGILTAPCEMHAFRPIALAGSELIYVH